MLGHFLLLHDLTEGRTVARAVLANDACATQRTIRITVSTFLGSVSSRRGRPASRAPRSVPVASPSPRTFIHDFHRHHRARRRELRARRNREYVPTFFVRFAISNNGFPSLFGAMKTRRQYTIRGRAAGFPRGSRRRCDSMRSVSRASTRGYRCVRKIRALSFVAPLARARRTAEACAEKADGARAWLASRRRGARVNHGPFFAFC